MNAENRKELNKAISMLEEAREIIERIKDEEQDKFDNLSEGLQQTERGQNMENAVSELENANNTIDDVIANIENAME